MHIWTPINGPVEIIVGPLLPSVFTAGLRLQDGQGGGTNFPSVTDANGAVHFHVPAADVQVVKSNALARLLLTTDHILIPGSPNPTWGWRYTVINLPGQATLPGAQLDGQGYFSSGPLNYPAGAPAPIAASAIAIRFQ